MGIIEIAVKIIEFIILFKILILLKNKRIIIPAATKAKPAVLVMNDIETNIEESKISLNFSVLRKIIRKYSPAKPVIKNIGSDQTLEYI
jgi:hypothetical protein